jgi:signal transduction histidine kinase
VKITLGVKIFAVHVVVAAITVPVIWVVFDRLAADYFRTLMQDYKIDPEAIDLVFLDAGHRYLLVASLVALLIAVSLSLLVTRTALAPLFRMIDVTQKIAAGDYSARVPVSTHDEVGQLAAAFNTMADSLERIEQLRKDMVTDVAHELRTPLTNVRGYLEALSDGVIEPSKSIFESLQEETLRVVQLVNDLGQLAKADAARAMLRKTPVALGDVVLEMLELFTPKFREKQIDVETALDGAQSPVMADPNALAQTVRNLLQNALQYTPSGGRVRVIGTRNADSTTVAFTNTGEGIAEADLPFIFERFYRGEKSRSREHGGAGIGLAIVKELIEAHAGMVGATSSAEETCVWFTLPS